MTTWQPLPTSKSFDVEDMIRRLYGKDRQQTILDKKCMACDMEQVTEDSFTDEISLTEYHISGLCQPCQEQTFNK